ncbi:hypothetical protein PFNF135_00341 [Plasmodium falciparum NF135/5.C10]|nr:hypothetical protein PFNF135_00341 [Plasmodium falciparum NF135/5.C10]
MENSIPYNLYIKKRNIFSLEENHNLNLNSLKNNDTYQVKLRHKYVHGYLSEKNNILKFLQNKFIYPIKNLIVIYDLINRDQFIFSHHTNQVFLIRCREKNRTVVSAEEEKRKIKIFVWNKLTLEILSEIKIKKENFIDIDYLNDKNIILLCKYNDKLILCIISLIYKNKEIRLNKKCVSVIKSLNDFYIHVKTEKTKGKDHEDEYFGKCKTGFLIEKNDLSKEKGSIYCIKNIKNINKRYVKQNRMIYSRLNEIMKKKKKKRRRKKKLVTNIPLCNNNFSYCKENQERFILIDTLKKKKLFKKSILKKIKNQKDLMNMIHIKSKKHQLINFSSYYIKFIKPLFNKNKYYNKSLYKNMKIVVDINENVCIYNDHYIFVYIIKDYNIYERLKYKNFKCSLFSSDHMFYLRKENFYFFYTFYFELFINSYLYNRYVCLKKYNDKCKIKKNEENYEQADEDEEKKFVHYKIGGNYFINDEADHMKKTKILIDSNEYNKNYVNIFNSTFVYKNYMDVECTNTFLHNNNNNKYDNNCNNNNKYDNNCNNNKYDYYYSSEQYYKFPPLVNIQINVVEIFNFVCTENSDDINVIFKIKDEYGKKRRAHTNRINTEQQKKRDSNKIIKRRNNRNHQINTPNQLSNNMIIKKKKKKKKNLIMKKYLVIGTKNGMIIINDFLKPHKIIHLEKICNEPIVSIFIFQNDMLILNRSGIIFFMDIHNFVIYRDIDIFFSLEHKTKNLSYENCNNNIKRNCTYNSEETTQFINGKKICNGKKMCDGKKIRDDDETFEDSTNLAYHHSNNLPCDTFEGKRIVNRMCNKKYNYDYKESYRTLKKRYINSFCHLNMYTILIGTTYNEIIIYNLLCDELCYIYDKNNKKISSYNIHNNNIIYSIENCLYKMNLKNYDTIKLLCLPTIYISSFVFYSDNLLICGSFKGNLYFIDICNNNNIKIINRIRKEDFVGKQRMRIHKEKEILFVFKKKIINNKYIINKTKSDNSAKIYNEQDMKKNNKIISIHLNKHKNILICSFTYCIYIYKLNISGNEKIDLRCISYLSIKNIIHIHVIKNMDNLFYITTRDDENISSYNYYLCSMNPCKIKTNKMEPLYFNILFENTWFYEFFYYNHKDDNQFLFVENNWNDERKNKSLILLDDSIFIIYTYCINKSRQSFEDTYYKQNNLMNVNNTSHVIKRNEYIGGKQKIYKNNKNNESTVNTSCDDYLGSTNQVKNTFPFNHNNNNKKKNKEKKTNIIHGKRNEQMDNSFNKFLSLIHTNNNSKAHVSNKSKKYDKIKIVKHIPQVVKSFKRRTNMCKMDNRKKDISLLSIIKNKEEKKKIHDIRINGESYNVVSKGVSIPVMLKNKLLNVRYEKEHLKKKNEEKEDCSKDEFLKKMKIIKKKKNNNNNKINNHYVTYKLLKSMLKRKKNIYLCESKKLNCKHDDDIIKKDTSFIRRGINNESYIRDDIYLGINEKNEIQRKNFKPNIEVNKEIIEIEQFCNRGGDLCVINNGEINNLSYCINKETKLRTKGLGYIQNYLKKYMNTDIKMKGEFRDNINRSSNSIKHINSNLYKISPQNSDTTNYMGEKDKFINSYHVNNYVHSMMIRLPQRESVTYIEKKKKNKIDITKYNAYTKLIKKGEGDKKKNLI